MHILTLTTRRRRRPGRQPRSTADARVYRRTSAPPEVGGGESVTPVAARLRVTARVTHPRVGTYARRRDPAARRGRGRSGRPRRLTDRGREVLGASVGRSPQDAGGFAAAWAAPLRCQPLARRLRRRPPTDTVRREWRRLGYPRGRSRYVLAPDPDAGGKGAVHPPADSWAPGPLGRPGRG